MPPVLSGGIFRLFHLVISPFICSFDVDKIIENEE